MQHFYIQLLFFLFIIIIWMPTYWACYYAITAYLMISSQVKRQRYVAYLKFDFIQRLIYLKISILCKRRYTEYNGRNSPRRRLTSPPFVQSYDITVPRRHVSHVRAFFTSHISLKSSDYRVTSLKLKKKPLQRNHADADHTMHARLYGHNKNLSRQQQVTRQATKFFTMCKAHPHSGTIDVTVDSVTLSIWRDATCTGGASAPHICRRTCWFFFFFNHFY